MDSIVMTAQRIPPTEERIMRSSLVVIDVSGRRDESPSRDDQDSSTDEDVNLVEEEINSEIPLPLKTPQMIIAVGENQE